MIKIKKVIVMFFPWILRRRLLNIWFEYEIHPTARIGIAWIFPKKLIMGPGSSIGHFTVAVNLDLIKMDEKSSIGRSNWITGFASGTASPHFAHQPDRNPTLLLGAHSSITKHHHIDCTNLVKIGDYVTIAGYYSQILTHSINIYDNRQDSVNIIIGNYTFVGTNSVILGGSVLPDYSLLAAKSMLSKNYTEQWKIYGGVPAKPLADISKNAKYFSRADGFVI